MRFFQGRALAGGRPKFSKGLIDKMRDEKPLLDILRLVSQGERERNEQSVITYQSACNGQAVF